MPTFSVRPPTGVADTPIEFTVTTGRAPRDRGEAAIGPATARALRVGIGSTVTVGDSHQQLHDLPPGAFFGAGPILQCAAVHELGHKILLALEVPGVIDGQDVRVI